ncbi:MAG: transposase [Planctomycetota bacterium]
MVEGLPSMRELDCLGVIRWCIRRGKEKPGFRVLEFAVLSNHLHFLVQADSRDELSRGMQGLLVRIARWLNKYWGRRGKVFGERFFASAARTKRAVRNALRYVLQNGRRHGIRLRADRPDPYTSGPWFRRWEGRVNRPFRDDESPVAMIRPTANNLEAVYRRCFLGLTELPICAGGRW